jgi:hypothetical protein
MTLIEDPKGKLTKEPEPLDDKHFIINNEYMVHEIGNRKCKGCLRWWDRELDTHKCGGLMHQEYDDEDWDGSTYTIDRCDKCGEPY